MRRSMRHRRKLPTYATLAGEEALDDDREPLVGVAVVDPVGAARGDKGPMTPESVVGAIVATEIPQAKVAGEAPSNAAGQAAGPSATEECRTR